MQEISKGESMKKLLSIAALCCLISVPALAGEPIGFIWQNTEHPLMGSGSVTPAKVGTATCKQFFGVVSLGNCSVKAAMDNGKIRALSHVDQKVKNIVGFKTIETRAYGN